MTKGMRTPGVYIVEKNAFPASVVEVETAVPAFIGYTETAEASQHKSLRNTPRRLTSMTEYREYFGGPPPNQFSITSKKPGESLEDPSIKLGEKDYFLVREGQQYNMHSCMMHFFLNGGGPCFMVSVGSYNDSIEEQNLAEGIDALRKEQEPTLVVIPDAVSLEEKNCANIQIKSLEHCRETQSRFAILDVYRGYLDRKTGPDCVDRFRDSIGTDNLTYGAAYFPWIETTVVQDSEINFENVVASSRKALQELVSNGIQSEDPRKTLIEELSAKMTGNLNEDQTSHIHNSLFTLSNPYRIIMKAIQKRVNLLPPSAAMAGVYTMVDNTRGVWKAPANVSLNGVVKPAVNISHDEQEDLNVNVQGKSINAIRSFVGEGTLVWGARTLDGNSLDWRYINVRRTLIMLEQSLKLASKAFVFEPNDANTWMTLKSMISNFLTDLWKRGGLAGATPEDAFSVHAGLGSTMTPEDIREGILIINVLVAATRPAEFIEITIRQQMQKQ